MGINWTDSQKKAIFDSNKDILVSAAAGSGKTTILIERIIEKILNGQDIDSLLVVTFTKLAAKEMKERLVARLRTEINNSKNPKNKLLLQQQLAKVPSADISTLHSFCSNVIKKFYYLIDLEPSFRLLTDETEQELLKEKAWDLVRDRHYRNDDLDFLNLTRNFSNDRDDNGLQDLVFQLFNFAITNPNSNEWLESLEKLYDLKSSNFEESSINKKIFEPKLVEKLNEQLQLIKKALSISLENESCEKFVDSLEQAVEELSKIINDIHIYSHDELGELLFKFSFKRAKVVKDAPKDGASEYVESVRKNVKKVISETIPNELLITDNNKLTTIINNSRDLIAKLVEVEKEFIAEFKNIKLANNTIDFNDLEHFTMDIFNSTENNINIAQDYYQNKFSEIMIDEYQDVNPMQESIVQMLRSTSNNFFMVGDIKQSIYGFRQAAPYLFASKYDNFKNKDSDNELVLLSNNFRSSKSVTTFVNKIFEMVMDKKLGDIDYNDETKLIPGAKFSDETDTQIEVNIIDLENEFEGGSKRDSQIQFVSSRVRKLFDDKFEIFDSKLNKFRPIKYSDIAILSRTKSNNTDLISEFAKSNIPVIVTDSQNYFQTMEIQVMIEFLKLIDNPQQDIPLVAVLRSPIVQLNENDLAKIRINESNFNFYNAVLKYAEENDDYIADKLKRFIGMLNSFRFSSNQVRISELIWDIYQTTGFLDLVTGMPGGKQRAANLHALYQRANEFEEMNFKGLYKFINFIERIEKNDKDLSQPNSIESDEDAVNVMTIHGSKGLEFPVVFLIDVAKDFNNRDYVSSNLIDIKLGLGIKYLDQENRIIYSTPPRSLISEKKRISSISEELRLLYVALTRAKQKLIVVGTSKKIEKSFNSWNNINISDNKIDYFDRINFKSYQDIIMSCIFQSSKKISDLSYVNDELNTQINIVSSIKNITEDENLTALSSNKRNVIDNSSKFKEIVKSILNLNYPFKYSTQTTAYQSVSEIKFLFSDPDEEQLQKSNIINSGRYVLNDFSKPNFLESDKSISAAEIGSATHLVLQKIDLKNEPTITSIEKLVADLQKNNIISNAVAKEINIKAIANFFESDLGKLVLENKENLKREYPFSMVVPASEIFNGVSENDDILIHGIIDGLVNTKEGIVIFDYKTDNVVDNKDAKNSVEEAVKKYSGQLNLYASAIKSIENKPVIGKYLFFLRLGKYVKI